MEPQHRGFSARPELPRSSMAPNFHKFLAALTGLSLLAPLALPSRTAAAGEAQAFSLDEVAPLFTGPASAAWRERRWADAARLFEEFCAKHGDDARAPQARLLAGLARARNGEAAEAAAHLQGLHARLGVLGPYARVNAAAQLLLLDRPEEALKELDGIAEGTPLHRRAERLRAEALKVAGKAREASALLDRLVRDGKAGASELKLAAELARVQAQEAQAAALERTLWLEHPLSSEVSGLAAPARLTPEEHLRRGRAFYEHDRHAQALAELELAMVPGAAKESRCTARFLRGHTRFKARQYADAVSELQRYLADRCPGPEGQKARALYYAGRAAARSRQPDRAIGFFERLVKEAPKSTLADDALLLASELLDDAGQKKKAAQALQRIIDSFPGGDMHEEAWWRLVWARYLAGDLQGALKLLTRAIEAGVHGSDYHDRGRLVYWRARILGRLGKRTEAIRLYRELTSSHPLGYYAQLAANRLRATDPRHLQGLFLRPEKAVGWDFAPQPLFGEPGFRRAVALLNVGLDSEAARELAALGLLDGKSKENGWLAALLFERGGMHARSHDIARRRLASFQDHLPDAAHRRFWHVAYPRAFAPQVVAAAKAEGVPQHLLFGLMREESAFLPDVVSYADAIGLTQLLLGTARQVAGKKASEVTAQSLRQPEQNLTLGARFLRGLLDRFGHPALAIAGYNAGGGAVSRWLKKWPTLAPDEWVECIPYEQTRNYTKRVIESYGRYRFLYGEGDERFLDLPITLKQAASASKPGKAQPAAKGKGKAAGRKAGKVGKAGKAGKAGRAGRQER